MKHLGEHQDGDDDYRRCDISPANRLWFALGAKVLVICVVIHTTKIANF